MKLKSIEKLRSLTPLGIGQDEFNEALDAIEREITARDKLRVKILKQLEEFNHDLCRAGCGVPCVKWVERKEATDRVKDKCADKLLELLVGDAE